MFLVKNWNSWSLDTNKVTCDYYDFLNKDSKAVSTFLGEYMAQYSWAEKTAGRLNDIAK